MDDSNDGIVDPHGRPVASDRVERTQRLHKLTKRTKAFIVAGAATLALVGGVVANIQRITGFVTPKSTEKTVTGHSAGTSQPTPVAATADRKASSTSDGEPRSVLFVDALVLSMPRYFREPRDEVKRAWEGPSTTLADATIATFVEALEQPHRIIHIEANVGHDHLDLSDGTLAGEQLAQAFKARSADTDCVVLACCNSFRIGKALENANVRYSVVVTRNLEMSIYNTFFTEFYLQLSKNEPIPIAYDRARLKTQIAHKDRFQDEIVLTEYPGPEAE